MIKRVEHVGIMVSDMDESIQFYETILGFERLIRIKNEQKEIVFLSHNGLPGFEIELIRDLEPTALYAKNGLVNHLAFIVSDMGDVISQYKQKGIIFETIEPKRGINGRRTIRFSGPNGEILQLVEER